jgi:hypothetical protein
MPVIIQKPALPVFDRRFYSWSAVAVALIVLVGFARTYYLKGFFGTRTLTPFVHFHGLVMSAWVVLFSCRHASLPRIVSLRTARSAFWVAASPCNCPDGCPSSTK